MVVMYDDSDGNDDHDDHGVDDDGLKSAIVLISWPKFVRGVDGGGGPFPLSLDKTLDPNIRESCKV